MAESLLEIPENTSVEEYMERFVVTTLVGEFQCIRKLTALEMSTLNTLIVYKLLEGEVVV